MSDIKKLFKRDRFYWGIMTVIMAIVVIYMLTNVSGLYHHKFFHLEDYLERAEWLRDFWDFDLENLRASWNEHPQLHYQDGIYLDSISNEFLNHMMLVTVIVVLIAQAVKLLVQETKNRTEVLRIFPVKSRNLLIYHYLNGLFTIGILLLIQIALIRLDILYLEKNTDFIFYNKEDLWSYAGFTILIFMLYYSLLLVCKTVTNHVPGTIFTFIVTAIGFGMLVIWGYWIILFWGSWIYFSIVLLIVLSYIANQEKDYARNGFYAFPIAHWMVMGIVFAEICFLFCGICSIPIAIAASALITAGVHFIARPKKI
ncbi:MAG: hypothetical protein K2K20_05620 [Lachnospiraceae bacterium]|nr:hypothetical protein [Lachnospiraceae bacterium]